MGMTTPKDGAPGTTDQSPRWEGPRGNKPRGRPRMIRIATVTRMAKTIATPRPEISAMR